MKTFDIVIIGSGVGLSILSSALNNGMKCAIVENSKFGGTCLTRGCIPSKVLVHPADIIRETQHAKKLGLDFSSPTVNWNTIADRMWQKIDANKNIENSISNTKGLATYKGTGEFTSSNTMKVKYNNGDYSEEFKSEKFVIAAGARSFVPPIPGIEELGYITSENFFGDAFPDKPWDSLVIVGGGAIGTEFAHIFSSFGTKVTVVEMKSRLVSTEEIEISQQLEKQFIHNGIDVLTNHKVMSVQKNNNIKNVTVQNTITGETKNIKTEEIFISSGIRSNADILKVEKAGIATDERGWIITNEYLETSQKNIWALGDINGKYQFRHKANYEADICNNNIFGGEHGHLHDKKAADYSKVPWAIFTNPQIAHVGITQEEALIKNERILVGKNNYSSVAKGFAMGYEEGDIDDGFVKLIADGNLKIVGVHIIGPHAAILIQSFVYLMNAGLSCTKHNGKEEYELDKTRPCLKSGTFDPMFRSIVIHPSLSEVTGWAIGKLEWVERE